MKTFGATVLLLTLLTTAAVAAAQSTSSPPPTLIPLSGQLTTPTGEPRTGNVQLTISLYAAQDDPAPLWLEYQVVPLDSAGRYSVYAGATLHDGLPSALFEAATARWLGVAVDNEAEQPRMVLVGVPYALRAATADMLGGKSATEFVLKSDDAHTANCTTPGIPCQSLETPLLTETPGGKLGIGTGTPLSILHAKDTVDSANFYLETTTIGDATSRFKNANQEYSFGLRGDVANAFIIRNVTSLTEPFVIDTAGNVGIGTITPAAKLHVVGGAFVGGNVGIGTTTPLGILHTKGPGSQNFYLESTTANDATSRFKNALQQWSFGLRADVAGAFVVRDATMSSDRLTIDTSGRVGIGTTTPTAALHVIGDVVVSGNIGAKYQDVAEWVDSAESLTPGTVVVIDPAATNRVAAAGRAYSTSVAGAVSAQPGVVLGEPGPGRVLVAQSGRVRIKADARYGAIKAGDLLVSSPVKGYAMRSRPIRVAGQSMHRPGTVLGKALEALPTGRGEILVLLTLQ